MCLQRMRGEIEQLVLCWEASVCRAYVTACCPAAAHLWLSAGACWLAAVAYHTLPCCLLPVPQSAVC
jgi:hypothetical protein